MNKVSEQSITRDIKANRNMKKIIRNLILSSFLILAVAACQAAPAAPQAGAGGFNGGNGNGGSAGYNGSGFTGNGGTGSGGAGYGTGGFNRTRQGTPGAGFAGRRGTPGAAGFFPGQGGQPTATATPTQADTPTPVPSPTDPTLGAVTGAQAYAAALQSADFSTASKLVSAFSLLQNKITAGDVSSSLTAQKLAGTVWSNFQVKEAQKFTDNTDLVHVAYTLTTKDAKTGNTSDASMDEQWPFRLEAGKWLYNWGNLIDFNTLTMDSKSTAGLSLTPLQLTRYSDRIRLTLMAQNSTNDAIVIGQPNQTLATFHFGDKAVDALNTRYIIDTMRTIPDVNIDVMGLFTSYPDSVDIVKYKSVTVAPWYTFTFGQ
jgi:hypothetical protein